MSVSCAHRLPTTPNDMTTTPMMQKARFMEYSFHGYSFKFRMSWFDRQYQLSSFIIRSFSVYPQVLLPGCRL